jgi:hypothetical protein
VTGKPRQAARTRRPGVSRETDLRRRSGIRPSRDTVLLLTNGTSTERRYFDGLRFEPWIQVTMQIATRSAEPDVLVDKAIALQEENDYDQVWVVCDVDEFDVSSAITKTARTDGVDLVLSAPCFEVWLILHKSAQCPGFNTATQADKHLRKLMPSWEKQRLKFCDFSEDVFTAVQRARQRGEPPETNPSTAVWRIIEHARKAQVE